MVPQKAHPKWAALVQGRFEYKFSNAAASMLLFRLKTDVKRDGSPAMLGKAVDEMHAFCCKYEKFLHQDLNTIFN